MKPTTETNTEEARSSAAPCSGGGDYRLINDNGERWIAKPDNGGDLGDMQGVVAELNRLLELLQKTHYNLIGRKGWNDPDAVRIGEAMGWDSGSQNNTDHKQKCGDIPPAAQKPT